MLKPGGEYIGYAKAEIFVQNLKSLEKIFTSVSTFQNVPSGFIGIKIIN